MLRRPRRYLKMLILIKVPIMLILSSFVSLVTVLLINTLVLHLLHAIVKSEVALSISTTHWNYSVHYIIPGHVFVIVRTHVLTSLSIDICVNISLKLALSLEIVLMTS